MIIISQTPVSSKICNLYARLDNTCLNSAVPFIYLSKNWIYKLLCNEVVLVFVLTDMYNLDYFLGFQFSSFINDLQAMAISDLNIQYSVTVI